jgi:hypothetical protein
LQSKTNPERRVELRRLQEEVIELEDLKTGISITDLGLNDFRMDLVNYVKTHGDLSSLPNGMHAVVPASTERGLVPGVIFALRNRNDGVNINRQNRLHPYYLVFVAQDDRGHVALPGMENDGFANEKITIQPDQLLENLQGVQRRHTLPISPELKKTSVCDLNLDIEMETGTGKTYCYIKTMFELNREYGWTKFIVVVPSIAIREGVLKSFEIMAEHFLEKYGQRTRYFVYNSKQLHNLESFSSDAGINVMIIDVQAFNARGEDARRIYLELDDFQSRRPIDVIKKNHPILILDEPQKMEGQETTQKLAEFDPLMILRYSATHKTEHNKVYRLDAIDAYNQKLVKKISGCWSHRRNARNIQRRRQQWEETRTFWRRSSTSSTCHMTRWYTLSAISTTGSSSTPAMWTSWQNSQHNCGSGSPARSAH